MYARPLGSHGFAKVHSRSYTRATDGQASAAAFCNVLTGTPLLHILANVREFCIAYSRTLGIPHFWSHEL